jgi:hypothetical protein
MTKQNGPWYDEEYLRQGSPTNTTYAESIPRYVAGGDMAIAATGVELAVAVPLQYGDLVTSIAFVVGGTAAGSPTAGYVCLRSPAGALLAQSADLGSTARAANTAYSIALATPQLITVPGMYLVGVSFTASTVPTLRGVTLGNAAVAGNIASLGGVVLVKSHGSAVGATAPATVATPTTTAAVPYLVLT